MAKTRTGAAPGRQKHRREAEDDSSQEIDKKSYQKELEKLQTELVKLQEWIKHKGLRVVVLFEGRDAAGKGGVIKRITQRLNPRICKVVALADATQFAVETFELQVQNITQDVSSRITFFCPGSTLKVDFANDDPLAYGMPEEGLVLFRSSPTFRIKPGRHSDQYKTIVRYVDEDVLQSGWLIGEKQIAKKAGMVEAKVGRGRVILIGFRTQHRCQTHGTFKLLFNTIIR